MLFRNLASFFIVAVLAGCAAQPPVTQSESVASQPPVATLLIPAPESSGGTAPSGPQDLAGKVRFKNYRYVGSGEYPDVESLQWKAQGSNFTVENYKAFLSRSSGRDLNKVFVSYDGTLAMAKTGGNYQLTFSLAKKSYYAEPNILDGKVRYQVSFAPSDVAANLAKAEMPWKVEVDSEFNTDSTYANFARLTRKEVFRGNGEKDPVTGKIFKERFWVRVAGREVPINVETYPYRNGSKAMVYATLPGTVSGNTVDFVSTADALKKEIERIIKS